MDKKKIFIMNLSKGRIGEENSRLIGTMLITKLYLAAMSRVDVLEKERADFYLYVDEFQNFATESFKDILSEARKYRLNLILAHQYIAQMDETVRDAVFGNIGTLISFRVGAYDAEVLEKEFAPEFTVQDLVNLGFASIYLKLMIDGVASRPFSATTLPPIAAEEKSHAEKIVLASREKYAKPREEVERIIAEWHAPAVSPEPAGKKFGSSTRPSDDAQPQLFEGICAVCGKRTYVPFKPDGKRPIFCKVHRVQTDQAISRQETGQPVRKTVSDIKRETISLSALEDRKPARPAAVKQGMPAGRQGPKLDELREVLNEVMDDLEDDSEKNDGGKKGILKPGDKIKFE